MATLAALLKSKGHDVRGSDQNVYPPMSDFLAQQGITLLQGYEPEHITAELDLVVVGNAISRGNPELEEVLDRKIRYCSLPEAVRDHFLWGARSVVIAGTHGKTTTTSLTGWLLAHGGADPSVLIGGIAENFDEQLSHRRRPRVRHRRRRVRQRLLRQDREVPEVPARHRRRQQHRVRPRRHLPGPRRDPARVPALREPGAAARPAAARRRQRRRAGAADARALPGRDVRADRRRRLAGARPASAAATSTAFSVRRRGDADRQLRAAAARRLQRPQRARGDRGRRRGRPRHRHDGRGAAALQGRAPPHGAPRHGRAASRSTTTSPTIRPRSPRRWPACARRIPTAASGRSSSRARRPRAAASSRPTSRARWRRPTACILPAVFRSSLPEDQRLSPEQLVADLQAAGVGRALHPATSTTSSRTVAREARDGDLVVVMSNGGFDDIHQKLLTALERAASSLTADVPVRILPAGDAALLVELPERDRSRRSTRWCVALRGRGQRRLGTAVRDVVVGYCSVTVYFDPLRVDAAWLEAELRRPPPRLDVDDAGAATARSSRCRSATAATLGPDLADVAALRRLLGRGSRRAARRA